jgi:hypothetical protein
MADRPDRPASDDFIWRGLTLERAAKASSARVQGMLEDLYGELMQKLSQVDPTGVPSWKNARLKQLEKLVRPLVKNTYGTIMRDVTSDMEGVAGSESEWVRNLVNKAYGDELMDVALHQRDLKTLASDLLIQGAPSREWWEKQAGGTQDAFMREVRMGALQGESIDQMARRIRGKPTGRRFSWYTKDGKHRWNVEFEGGVLQANTRDAKALVRTSIMAAAGQSRRETYLANRDVVKGIEQISTLDTRTTKICMAYDGEKWEFEDQDTESSLTQAAREAHTKKAKTPPVRGKAVAPGRTAGAGATPLPEEAFTEGGYSVQEGGGAQQQKKKPYPELSENQMARAYDGWASDLTEDDLVAIGDYVGGTYQDLNTFLRSAEKKTSGHNKAALREWRDQLDALVAESPGAPRDMSVFRIGSPKMLGAKSGADVAALNKSIGKTVSDKAFVSTSVSRDMIKDIYPDEEVAFRIQVNKGAKGIFMPSVAKRQRSLLGYAPQEMDLEGEFLLGREAQFSVIGVEEGDAGSVVVLEYLGG